MKQNNRWEIGFNINKFKSWAKLKWDIQGWGKWSPRNFRAYIFLAYFVV